jgi:protein TonB
MYVSGETMPTSTTSFPSEDRLHLALLLSLLVHGVLILGVNFTFTLQSPPPPATLDILLVPPQQEKIPEQADYLAQVSQEGGNEPREEVHKPRSPAFSSETMADVKAAKTLPDAKEPLPPAKKASSKPSSPAAKAVSPPILAAPKARQKAPEALPTKGLRSPAPPRTEEGMETIPDPPKTMDTATLLSQAVENVHSEIEQKYRHYKQRPRHKAISARTKEYKYASYMEAWRAKVEMVGNLNYPEDARRKQLSGNLLLEVAINPNGSIHQVILRRSSGHKILDEAAIRIVHLAAPFAPLPEDILAETDILHISRTWQFLHGNRLTSR